MKILISGINSGLGRFLYENLGGTGFDKSDCPDTWPNKLIQTKFDCIIHCAFNSAQSVKAKDLPEYIDDNVILTQRLLALEYKKFIFMSSVDVYPKDGKLHSEDEIIDQAKTCGLYALTKSISEEMVKQQSRNYLILRCSSLLGKYSRKNSLIRLLEAKKGFALSLSKNSKFNFVLHSDLLRFINIAIAHDYRGVYNIASKDSISLLRLADHLGKTVKFGKFVYNAGKINTEKINSTYKGFKKRSISVVDEFVKEVENG